MARLWALAVLAAAAATAPPALPGEALDGALDEVIEAAGRLRSVVARLAHATDGSIAASPAPASGQPSPSTELRGGDLALCSWHNGTCTVDDARAAHVVEQMPEGSPIRAHAEQQRDCLRLNCSQSCGSDRHCQWDSASGRCGNADDLNVLVGKWFGNPASCGFLADMFAAAACTTRPVDKCAESTTGAMCAVQEYSLTVPLRAVNGSACDLVPRCVSARDAQSIVTAALCNPTYDKVAVFADCQNRSISSGGSSDVFLGCMKEACPIMGDLWEANMRARCDSLSDEGACNNRTDCLWKWQTGACRFDGSRLLLRKVPDRCAVKRQVAMHTECLRQPREACVGNCTWSSVLDCDMTGTVMPQGSCKLDDAVRLRALAEDTGREEARLLAQLFRASESCARRSSEPDCSNAALPATAPPVATAVLFP